MLLTDTFWNRSYRYDLNQARAVLWIPNVYSRRVRRMVWTIVSKAAERSRSVRSESQRLEVSDLQCEGGRSRFQGWSGR